MVRWHHQLDEHECEQTPGDGEGQGSLECCSSWVSRVRHDLAAEQPQQQGIQKGMVKYALVSYYHPWA